MLLRYQQPSVLLHIARHPESLCVTREFQRAYGAPVQRVAREFSLHSRGQSQPFLAFVGAG